MSLLELQLLVFLVCLVCLAMAGKEEAIPSFSIGYVLAWAVVTLLLGLWS